MLVHNVKLKVKDNKSNLSVPIDKFIIRQLRWDLDTCDLVVEVDYYFEGDFIFTNDYVWNDKRGDVDVNKLIDEVIKNHYG